MVRTDTRLLCDPPLRDCDEQYGKAVIKLSGPFIYGQLGW